MGTANYPGSDRGNRKIVAEMIAHMGELSGSMQIKGLPTGITLNEPGWHKHARLPIWLWADTQSGARQLRELESQPIDNATLRELVGHWAIVDLRGKDPLVAVDRIRSRPLFYTRQDGEWIITDSVEQFRDTRLFTREKQAAESFRHMGFVPGTRTLIDGVQVTTAGTASKLTEWGPEESPYFEFLFGEESITDWGTYSEMFTQTLDTVFTRMLDSHPGKDFLVPVSGGMDSRLILVWLRRMGVSNVTAFTYGRPGGEATVAEEVSKKLGVPFIFVPYDREKLVEAWRSPETTVFLKKNWTGASLPHIQDWYALRELKERGILTDKTVVLPGHTIVGNAHNQDLFDTNPPPSRLGKALAEYHGDLAGHAEQIYSDPYFQESVNQVLKDVSYDGTASSVQSVIELFNLRERQTKYINNSMRAYEYFGAAWALPMLDKEMWDVWLRGGRNVTQTRDWYGWFVSQVYGEQTGEPLEYHDMRKAPTKSFVDSSFGRWLAGTSLAPRLNALRSTAIWLKDPLTLDAFASDVPNPQRTLRMASGTAMRGLWTDSFLRGTWGSGEMIPPPDGREPNANTA